MSKTIVVVGYGPGVSTAVAERFGAEGYSVALIARSQSKILAGVERLKGLGVTAGAFPADAGDPRSIRSAIAKARVSLGPIGAIHWNAYSGAGLGDLLTIDPETLPILYNVALVGLLSAVQEALLDLKAAGDGAILVTNGAFGELDPTIDTMALSLGATGVALGNAAKAKMVGLLSARLKAEGVYVGEVTIAGVVKGTGPESPNIPMIEGAAIAEAFWSLFKARGMVRMRISS